MSKRFRQYIGILAAVAAYYGIHEGAHLAYALLAGTFRRIQIIGLGIQIDVYAEAMTDLQLGIFCLTGVLATFTAGWVLILAAPWICRRRSKMFRAVCYYVTLAMLLADPIYLGLLAPFVGGGDLNGICLLIPKPAAQGVFLALLAANGWIFWKIILPQYTRSFQEA